MHLSDREYKYYGKPVSPRRVGLFPQITSLLVYPLCKSEFTLPCILEGGQVNIRKNKTNHLLVIEAVRMVLLDQFFF